MWGSAGRRGGARGRPVRARRVLRAARDRVQAVLLLRQRDQDLPIVSPRPDFQRTGVCSEGSVHLSGMSGSAATRGHRAHARGRTLPETRLGDTHDVPDYSIYFEAVNYNGALIDALLLSVTSRSTHLPPTL